MTTTPARAADEDPSTGPQVVMNAESRDSSRLTEIGIQNNFTGLAPVSTMRTLPRDVAAFTGRDAELRQLVAAATGAAGVVAIHTVDGMPGVGKTALVTRAAHLLADDFPDGQLFVDLYAHTPGMKPAKPGEVLAGLLACTGMAPGEIPAGLEARVERWRGHLAGKKVLLVLDDAAGHAQVEPLLPGTAGCLVLVTSRHRLIALDGAQPLQLDTLPPEQANELFTRLARRPQDGSDAGTVAKLTGLCDYLPLAIALLAGRLAHHPSWDITTYSAGFAAAQDRLSELTAGDRPGDPAVAAAFEMSYQELPEGRQRLFRRLGLHPGPDIDAYAAAALADIPLTEARQGLDALYTDHLIDEPVPGRYRLHDLIREYARTLAARHDPANDRDQATRHLLDYYQYTAQAADRRLARRTRPGPAAVSTAPIAAPDLPGPAAALAWMRGERANLLACIGHATTQEQPERTIALTSAMAAFLYQEGPWHRAAALHHAAATTACHLGDRLGEANALWDLGRVRYKIDDYPAAASLHERAMALYRGLGDRLGEANALLEQGRVHFMTGDYPAAAGLLQRALALYQDLGDRLGEARALWDLGRVRELTGDYPAAAGLQERALALYQDLGDRLGEAGALWDLGFVRSTTGDYPAAAGLQQRALALYQDLGDRLGEASALWDLGRVRELTGDYPAAACRSGPGPLPAPWAATASWALGPGPRPHMTGDYPAAAGWSGPWPSTRTSATVSARPGPSGTWAVSGPRPGTTRPPSACYSGPWPSTRTSVAATARPGALHELGRVRHMTADYPAAAACCSGPLRFSGKSASARGSRGSRQHRRPRRRVRGAAGSAGPVPASPPARPPGPQSPGRGPRARRRRPLRGAHG